MNNNPAGLTHDQIKNCLIVCYFTFWKKVKGKSSLKFKFGTKKVSIVTVNDENTPIFSFSNDNFSCINVLRKFLQSVRFESNITITKRIEAHIASQFKDNGRGKSERSMFNMLMVMINEMSLIFTSEWKCDEDADLIIDTITGKEVFYQPNGLSHETLQYILNTRDMLVPADTNIVLAARSHAGSHVY